MSFEADSGVVAEMKTRTLLPRTLYDGTLALREQCRTFLPQHEKESENQYRARVQRSVLRNYYKHTISTFAGKVFKEEISVDTDERIIELLDNVDLTGQGLGAFSKEVFKEALIKGVSLVLVDYPERSDEEEGSLLEQNAKRPFLERLNFDTVLSFASEFTEKGEELTFLKVKEKEVVTTPQGEDIKNVIKVWKKEEGKVLLERWEENENEATGWILADTKEYEGMDIIPIFPFYTEKTGFFEATPPLEDLAYMNLEHFQIRSDQRNALSVASFPIIAGYGIPTEEAKQIAVAPNKAFIFENDTSRVEFLESKGIHLEAGRTELKDLEDTMRMFGSQFEDSGNARETATGRAIDEQQASAGLRSWAKEYCNFTEKLLEALAKWQGIELTENTVTIDTDFGFNSSSEYTTLLNSFSIGLISKKSALEEVKRRGLLHKDFNIESDIGLSAVAEIEDV